METRRRKSDSQQQSTADDLRHQDRRDDFQASNNDAIARRAYELYESRGREDGQDQEDWFQAEREVRRRSSSPVKP
jgi:DUF2934 family protein